MQPWTRRPRWQLLALLAAAAALFGYDRTLDRTQDVFRPPELDVLGVLTILLKMQHFLTTPNRWFAKG